MIEAPAFYRVAHQKIYDAMVGAATTATSASTSSPLTEELRKRGELEAVGGIAALTQITEYAATSANLEQHIRIVHEKAVLRALIKAASRDPAARRTPPATRPPRSSIAPSSASSRSPTSACAQGFVSMQGSA